MTPEEIAYLNTKVPGFASLSPEQQEQLSMRLKLSQSAQATQPSMVNQAVPVAGAVAVNQGLTRLGGASVASPSTASFTPATQTAWNAGVTQAGGGVPAAAAPSVMSNFSALGIGPQAGIAAGTALTVKGVNDALKGKNDTSGIGTAARIQSGISSFGATEVARLAGLDKLFGGKSEDQRGRDDYRNILKQAGIYDNDYNLSLLDGTKVNMGLDGSVKNYNVDFKEPNIGNIVALTNPFAYLVTSGDPKKASDLAGELTNAIKGAKDPVAEMRNIFTRAGIDQASAIEGINQLKVDDATKNVFRNTVNSLKLPTNTGGVTGTSGGGGIKIIYNVQQAPKAQKVDNTNSVRMGILNNMLQNTTQPIQYPRQKVQGSNPASTTLNSTLNRIIGG